MSRRNLSILACLAGSLVSAAALAQTPLPLSNPSFEDENLFDGRTPHQPLGWHDISNPIRAKRRAVGDGLSPQVFPVGTPNALTPRTGNAMIQLSGSAGGGFAGFTTDTINFSLPTFPFYDPFYDHNLGDVVVSGYYMIPASDPIVGDSAYFKLNVKYLNQDVATLDGFCTDSPTCGSIQGHTDGQWRQFTVTFRKDEIVRQLECNQGIRPNCGCVCVPTSAVPNHVKITIGRFIGDGTPASGTVYFDDMSFEQLPLTPTCIADVDDGTGTGTPDGGVTIDDLLYYLQIFEAGTANADVDDGSGTGTPDGGVTIDDLLYYLFRFEAGC